MRCYKCGKEMEQTGAISQFLKTGVYQTTRHYRCKHCNSTFEETDDPMEETI